MYTALKKVTKALIAKKFLLKHEFLLRRLIAIPYLGTTYHCEICNTKLNRFIKLEPNDLLCPACGSRSRTRRLYRLLLKESALTGNVLHFSPSPSLYRVFKKIKAISYVSTDFENEFVADYSLDIRKINFEAQYFDTIICCHILEHIEEDYIAIKELYRVLRPSGKCYIQTPFKDGNLYENASITSKSERLKAFGQEDHVRIYSIEGLKERLEHAGFNVSILTFTPKEIDKFYGYQSPETVIIASKY
jgi:SAM-dependent methyltransferase